MQTLDHFLDLSSNCDNETLPSYAKDATPWRDIPFDVIQDMVQSTTICKDEIQQQRVLDFVNTHYDMFSEHDIKKKFPRFPKYYYKFLAQAANDKFKVMVKDEKDAWEIKKEPTEINLNN